MATVASQTAEPVGLKELLVERLAEEKVHPYLVPGSYVRASGFPDICIREEVLCALHEIVVKETIKPDLQMIFAHGTALHTALQSDILPRLKDVLYGSWRCEDCGRVMGGAAKGFDPEAIIPYPSKCTNARCSSRKHGSPHFIYEEASLESEYKYRITGHPDGFIKLPGYDGLGILEAKSCSAGKARQVRNCPDIGHVVQAHIYLWLTGLKWTLILYWEKGANGVDALIEHYVDRDEDLIDRIKSTLDQLFSTLDPWWEYKAEQKKAGNAAITMAKPFALPERICGDKHCDRAQVCGAVDICFKENA